MVHASPVAFIEDKRWRGLPYMLIFGLLSEDVCFG